MPDYIRDPIRVLLKMKDDSKRGHVKRFTP